MNAAILQVILPLQNTCSRRRVLGPTAIIKLIIYLFKKKTKQQVTGWCKKHVNR